MVFDVANNVVLLDAVTRFDDGSEESRETLASRNKTLSLDTEYNLKIVTEEIETGVYAAYCYVDNFLLLQAEDLDTIFQKGMHGFECLGADGDYSLFKNAIYTDVFPYNQNLDRVKDLLGNPQNLDEQLNRDLEAANSEVDDVLLNKGFTVPLTTASASIKEAEALIAASKFKGRGHSDQMMKDSENFRAEATRILDAYTVANKTVELPFVLGEDE